MDKSLAIAYAIKRKNQKAKGGMVGSSAKGGIVEDGEPTSMIDSIMKKRKRMAEGDNGMDDFDKDEAQNVEMVDGLEDHNDFLSDAPQEPTEEDQKMNRSKMLGSILNRVRYAEK